jgi:hypothetical protein
MRSDFDKSISSRGICNSLSTHKSTLAPILCVHRCHFPYLSDGLNYVCPSLLIRSSDLVRFPCYFIN